jgi:tRNA threonylcarbamoyl adenosine modification protein YeaZ
VSREQARGSGLLLAIETATGEAVVALGRRGGGLIAYDRWPADHNHGERLLASIQKILAQGGSSLGDVGAIVVGIGPGSFTGLRVGLAVAKGLAFGLDIRIVGIETPVALAAALAGRNDGQTDGSTVVLQPAGPSGRYVTVVARDQTGRHRLTWPPAMIGADEELPIAAGARQLAVDLPDAQVDASAAGASARDALGETLLRLGAARLRSGEHEDLAELVPAYVTLPRGAVSGTGGITWSPGLR